jgi:hypothetical protein
MCWLVGLTKLAKNTKNVLEDIKITQPNGALPAKET